MSRVCVSWLTVVSRNAPTQQFEQPTVEIWLFEQTSKLFKCNCCAKIHLLGRYKNAAAITWNTRFQNVSFWYLVLSPGWCVTAVAIASRKMKMFMIQSAKPLVGWAKDDLECRLHLHDDPWLSDKLADDPIVNPIQFHKAGTTAALLPDQLRLVIRIWLKVCKMLFTSHCTMCTLFSW